jgi:hypothetical protein
VSDDGFRKLPVPPASAPAAPDDTFRKLPVPPASAPTTTDDTFRKLPNNPAPPAATGERTLTYRKSAGTDVGLVVPAGQDTQPAPTPVQPPAAPPLLANRSQIVLPIQEPKKSDVFRMDNNAVLEARIRAYVGRIDMPLPKLPELTSDKYVNRNYPPSKIELEPGYTVHRRLLFEEKNAERYGWDAGGAVQPFLSTAYFYRDCLFLPYNFASNLHECYDTSAGKCLPGSPVPYFIYPPDLSITGTAAELGVATALAFIFP